MATIWIWFYDVEDAHHGGNKLAWKKLHKHDINISQIKNSNTKACITTTKSDAIGNFLTNVNTAFKWMLRCHWLIGLRPCQIATVIRSRGDRLNTKMSSYQYRDPSMLEIRRSRDLLIFNMESHTWKDLCILIRGPGPRFNIKMTSYQYMKSHCGDKTIIWPSYIHNGICYTGKTTSLYWIGALGAVSIRKTVLPGMAIPMLKIRRPDGRLIFNMEIAIRR